MMKKVSEPAMADQTNLAGLKNRLIAAVGKSDDVDALEYCMELMQHDDLPNMFSQDADIDALYRPGMNVSEPTVPYRAKTTYLTDLKSRLITAIDQCKSENVLEYGLDCVLHEEIYDSLCKIYADNKFTEELRMAKKSGRATREELDEIYERWLDEEIRMAEASGIASDEEVAKMYARWGR
jgi:hypothetical protein